MSLNSTTDINVAKRIYIGRNPEICGGEPIIVGTRIRVTDIVALILADKNMEDVLECYPHITSMQIDAAIDYWADNKLEIDRLMKLDETCEG